MIKKFLLYICDFAFDIFDVNFLIDPIVGTAFFALFGELTAVWSVLRIIFLMGILIISCLAVNSKDSAMLDVCVSEITACQKEGTKTDMPKPSDFKSFLGENYAFAALGVFMLAYVSPAILIHGHILLFIPAVIVIGGAVAVYLIINSRFAQERLDALIEYRFKGIKFEDNKKD